jgi:hypothetical protein
MRALMAFCLSMYVAPFAAAQTAVEAQLSGQPLMYMKDGKVDGCGIRLVGVVVLSTLKDGIALDASVNIYNTGVGVVKALSYDVTLGAGQAGSKHRTMAIDRFWLKSPSGEATHPQDGQFHKTDDGGGRLYTVTVEDALNLLLAAATGNVVTLGLKRSAESHERIYFGRAKMTEGEKNQVISCMDSLVARMSKSLEVGTPKAP